MRIHNSFANRQAESHALAGSSFSAAKDLVELQEDFLLVIVLHSITAVRHRNGGSGHRRRMIIAHLDANRRILG